MGFFGHLLISSRAPYIRELLTQVKGCRASRALRRTPCRRSSRCGDYARGTGQCGYSHTAGRSTRARRIASRNNHGTGCTLSSAIAGYRARGSDVEEAVRKAKIYIQQAIRAGAEYTIGHGHGPVHHFFNFWE